MTTPNDSPEFKPIPVPQLPWYETLRIFMEPYMPAASAESAELQFTSTQIINQIESHHGIPMGIVGKDIVVLVSPDDFVRAMIYLGFHAYNFSDQLAWGLIRRTTTTG